MSKQIKWMIGMATSSLVVAAGLAFAQGGAGGSSQGEVQQHSDRKADSAYQGATPQTANEANATQNGPQTGSRSAGTAPARDGSTMNRSTTDGTMPNNVNVPTANDPSTARMPADNANYSTNPATPRSNSAGSYDASSTRDDGSNSDGTLAPRADRN